MPKPIRLSGKAQRRAQPKWDGSADFTRVKPPRSSGSTAEDDSPLAYRDTRRVARRIEAAYEQSSAYLDEHLC